MHYCIDFGHCLSGADTGASGNGYREENCTREIGLKLAQKLKSLGNEVTMISFDYAPSLNWSLSERQRTINSCGCDLAVSIHLNAGGGRGVEIWVDGYSNSIAEKILPQLSALGYVNRGLKTGELAVVNYVNPKAMLVECGFIDSSEDMNRYNPDNIAEAICRGLTGASTTNIGDDEVKIGLDDPNNITITNSDVLNVRGWVLGEWNTVEIWIDGNNFGGVELGKPRPDVYDAYPQYGDRNAGFTKTIKFNGIDNGKHECRLKVCDKVGKFHEIAKSFTIDKELRIALDAPNKTVNTQIKGWALSGKGIKSIKCYVDGGYIGDFKINKTREDVAKVYDYYYNGVQCGFEYDFNGKLYTKGEHVFKLRVESNDGEVKEIGSVFLGEKVGEEIHDCESIQRENAELKKKLEEINKISEV